MLCRKFERLDLLPLSDYVSVVCCLILRAEKILKDVFAHSRGARLSACEVCETPEGEKYGHFLYRLYHVCMCVLKGFILEDL